MRTLGLAEKFHIDYINVGKQKYEFFYKVENKRVFPICYTDLLDYWIVWKLPYCVKGLKPIQYKDWLEEHTRGLWYAKYTYRNIEWHISDVYFQNRKDAILFKLTTCDSKN